MKLKCPLLLNMPSKKNQQNYSIFYPSEQFTFAHFNVRYPVVVATYFVVVVRWLSRVDKLWFQHNCRTHLSQPNQPFSVSTTTEAESDFAQ